MTTDKEELRRTEELMVTGVDSEVTTEELMIDSKVTTAVRATEEHMVTAVDSEVTTEEEELRATS